MSAFLSNSVRYAAFTLIIVIGFMQHGHASEIIEDHEYTGLYRSPQTTGLDRDLWENSRHDHVYLLVKHMPVHADIPVLKKIISDVLLLETRPGQTPEGITLAPTDDFLSLRLEKLFEKGAYDKAHQLYARLDEKPENSGIIEKGIMALMYNSKKSLACVEAKTFSEKIREPSEQWTHFLAYCDYTLTDGADDEAKAVLNESNDQILKALANDQDFSFTYAPKLFAELTPFQRALIASEKALRIEEFPLDKIAAIPPQDLLLLLNAPDISEAQQFLLSLRAGQWGLFDDTRIVETFNFFIQPAGGDEAEDEKKAQDLPAQPWKQIIYYYRQFKAAEDDKSAWDAYKAAYPLLREFGFAGAYAFADKIPSIRLDNPDYSDIGIAIKTMNYANIEPPSHWLRTPSGRQVGTLSPQDLAVLLAVAHYTDEEKTEKMVLEILRNEEISATDKKLYSKFIEKIDKVYKNKHNAAKAYEKEIFLTYAQDYVMPTSHVWDSLLRAGQIGAVGEICTLSTFILSDRNLQNIYPKLFQDILQSYENVGLTNISQSLAVAALLEDI